MTTNNKEQSIKNFTRGGQIILHNARMFAQVFSMVSLSSAVVFIFTLVLAMYLQLSNRDFALLRAWGSAEINLRVYGKNVIQQVNLPDRVIKNIPSAMVLSSPSVLEVKHKSLRALLTATAIASALSLLYFIITYRFLRRQGKAQGETKQIRGDEFAAFNTVKQMVLRSKQVSDIQIAGLPMPIGFECRHIMMHGSPGTGKSELIKSILAQIRERGDRVIIYDKGGDYIRYFYDDKKDHILNGLDARSESWHLWNECRDFADYDSLGAALIPHAQGGTDPFWVNAARTVFAATARKMASQKDRSMAELLHKILVADLDEMGDFLQGTEAEILVSKKIEKTAVSVKSVLAAALKSLRYIQDDPHGFSIRKWIQNDAQSNWLFVSSLADRHETLRPLITMWLDIAVNAIMSLEPSHDRRIWVILDELPTLNKLPYLVSSLAETRKFGGCFLTGVQSIAQLREIYGLNGAESVSGLSNTKFFLRSPSFETAQWVSRQLGQEEIEEAREGVSYSESAMRSGISISKQASSKQIVSPSEIMGLKDMEAYVRLPGGYPITKVEFEYQKREVVNRPHIPMGSND